MAKDSKKIPGVTGKDIKNTLIPMLDTLDDINEGATATITVDDRASKPLKNIQDTANKTADAIEKVSNIAKKAGNETSKAFKSANKKKQLENNFIRYRDFLEKTGGTRQEKQLASASANIENAYKEEIDKTVFNKSDTIRKKTEKIIDSYINNINESMLDAKNYKAKGKQQSAISLLYKTSDLSSVLYDEDDYKESSEAFINKLKNSGKKINDEIKNQVEIREKLYSAFKNLEEKTNFNNTDFSNKDKNYEDIKNVLKMVQIAKQIEYIDTEKIGLSNDSHLINVSDIQNKLQSMVNNVTAPGAISQAFSEEISKVKNVYKELDLYLDSFKSGDVKSTDGIFEAIEIASEKAASNVKKDAEEIKKELSNLERYISDNTKFTGAAKNGWNRLNLADDNKQKAKNLNEQTQYEFVGQVANRIRNNSLSEKHIASDAYKYYEQLLEENEDLRNLANNIINYSGISPTQSPISSISNEIPVVVDAEKVEKEKDVINEYKDALRLAKELDIDINEFEVVDETETVNIKEQTEAINRLIESKEKMLQLNPKKVDIGESKPTDSIEQNSDSSYHGSIGEKATNLEDLLEQYNYLRSINHDLNLYKGSEDFNVLLAKTGSTYEELKKFKQEILEMNPLLKQISDYTDRISKSKFNEMFGSYFESSDDAIKHETKDFEAEVTSFIDSISKLENYQSADPQWMHEYVSQIRKGEIELSVALDGYKNKLASKMQEIAEVQERNRKIEQSERIIENQKKWVDKFDPVLNDDNFNISGKKAATDNLRSWTEKVRDYNNNPEKYAWKDNYKDIITVGWYKAYQNAEKQGVAQSVLARYNTDKNNEEIYKESLNRIQSYYDEAKRIIKEEEKNIQNLLHKKNDEEPEKQDSRYKVKKAPLLKKEESKVVEEEKTSRYKVNRNEPLLKKAETSAEKTADVVENAKEKEKEAYEKEAQSAEEAAERIEDAERKIRESQDVGSGNKNTGDKEKNIISTLNTDTIKSITYKDEIGRTYTEGKKYNSKEDTWESFSKVLTNYKELEKQAIKFNNELAQTYASLDTELRKDNPNQDVIDAYRDYIIELENELDKIDAQVTSYDRETGLGSEYSKALFNKRVDEETNRFAAKLGIQTAKQRAKEQERADKQKKNDKYSQEERDAIKELFANSNVMFGDMSYSDMNVDSTGKGFIKFVEQVGDKCKETTVYIDDLYDAINRVDDKGNFDASGLLEKDTVKNTSSENKKQIDPYFGTIKSAIKTQENAPYVVEEYKQKFVELGYSVEEAAKKVEILFRISEKLKDFDIESESDRNLVSSFNREKESLDRQIKQERADKQILNKEQKNLLDSEGRYYALRAKYDSGSISYDEKDELDNLENKYKEIINVIEEKNNKTEEEILIQTRLSDILNESTDKIKQMSDFINQSNNTKGVLDNKRDLLGNDLSSYYDNKINELDLDLQNSKTFDTKTFDKYLKDLLAIEKEIDNIKYKFDTADIVDDEKISEAMRSYISSLDGTAISIGKFDKKNKSLNLTFKDSDGKIHSVTLAYDKLKKTIDETNHVVDKQKGGFLEGIGKRLTSLGQYLSTFVSFYEVINILRQGVDIVKEFDAALIEMAKVSDESMASLKKFQNQSFDLANSVGTTAVEIQNSTADFMRLGKLRFV